MKENARESNFLCGALKATAEASLPSSLPLFSQPLIPIEQGKDVREVAGSPDDLLLRLSHSRGRCVAVTANGFLLTYILI